MTAVLSPTDALRRDKMSLDDTQINYSSGSTDWRAKYNEVCDMLEQTRAELDDFHQSSKELETELENELQRTEKAQQDLKVKAARAENERDEWKSKFMSLQTTHNHTTTSLQRELDRLRKEHQQVKLSLRELEMGNDDLERNERAVSSNLADVENKYSRVLEEKILLEHELLDKASMEEEFQRLKDDLRDANVEISILKDQLAASPSPSTQRSPEKPEPARLPSEEDLLHTMPPSDMTLSDLSPASEPSSTDSMDSLHMTPKGRSTLSTSTTSSGQSALLHRAGFQPGRTFTTPPGSSGISRASTLPTFHGSPTNLRTPTRSPTSTRPSAYRTASTTSNASTNTTATRNKGVQMVSEMRARVKNLEQKIHTRVPRLRMGSVSGKPSPNPLGASSISNYQTMSTSATSRAGLAKSSWEGISRRSVEVKRSTDSTSDKPKKSADSSGWVLIMEDSPSPPKMPDRERRRASSPQRPGLSTRGSPTRPTKPSGLGQSSISTGMKRPQSRLSGGSMSTTTSSLSATTATTSSIPTPTSRPSTPTLLPIPSSGLYAPTNGGLKRSTGPLAVSKRSSLGASTGIPPPPSRPSSSMEKPLPGLSNVTVRSRLPPSASNASLSKSRIGRPSGGGSGRRSAGGDSDLDIRELRPRSGSSAAVLSK
ncbi:hypothetical protein BD626DRAFT_397963 [Schizophyllum amplum]|uniref:NUDE domain-containing protein n=1 Tax=Schizophyllum amplum TaxID=97359 RepID=A0A550CLR8_9AGAR|nr:hypothetical protein BD626DRAFT_397963 [Auriculariopsis ampla]